MNLMAVAFCSDVARKPGTRYLRPFWKKIFMFHVKGGATPADSILWEAELGFVLRTVVSSSHHRSDVDRTDDQNSVNHVHRIVIANRFVQD